VLARRRPAGGRRRHAAILAICLALPLVGCVPIEANEQPLEMTVQDDHLLFRWCGNEPLTGSRIDISYALIRGTIRDDHTAAEGTGPFSLTRGDEFSNSTPPPNVIYTASETIPFSSPKTLVFVSIGPDAKTFDFSASYEVLDRFAKLREGYWMDPTGKLSRTACATN